ncbi:hypothetical protein HYH02_013719 [Chlamydomonas schloesseri]|uniref:Rhodanese domain-containing protein n=1 Tax=Chlamydomonas schloesseri TaxID=2026947 RepID=A0A835SNE1_9CHLO|nr:hypothetical protein HYH02_013719 [Chlamydomonas schloesseri]|eukprot:KAG2430357.1 hypothetical protein HYH02_013719 [Chlamydomonas schloesseri]
MMRSSRLARAVRALPEHGPVVDTTWLKRNLEEDIRIFDARGSAGGALAAEQGAQAAPVGGARPTADYDGYLEGHVPGAVFVNWTRDGARYLDHGAAGGDGGEQEGQEEAQEEQEEEGRASTSGRPWDGWRRRLARPSGGSTGSGLLAAESDPDVYVPCLEARGLSAEQAVVVYDDGRSMTAARVWWSLLLFGHPRPYILAGGWDAWRAGGGGSELYEPCPLKLSTTFEAEPRPQYRASAGEFIAAAEQGATAAAAAGGGPGPVAVLLLPEGRGEGLDAGPLPPGLRGLALADLLPVASAAAAGAGRGAGAELLTEAAAIACAAGDGQKAELQRALRARLGVGLGLEAGALGNVGARLLLASPHDAGVSACVLGALLNGAGHSNWAVCDLL